jgi:glycosyltransferase involved in cell wall biosynthesis
MEKHCTELAEELAELGHDVHVLAHSNYQDKFPEPVRFHPCPVSLGRRNPWLRWKLRRTLQHIRPNIVHAHGNKAATLAALTKQPHWQTIGTVHGTKSNVRPFTSLDKVIAVSQAIYDQIQHPRKYLIYNGVKQLDSSPGTFPLKGSIKVVAAGRLEPVKGFCKLIQAWERACYSIPGVHLTIFGDGSQKGHLNELVRSRRLTNSVTFEGFHSEIGSILRSADLLVISSEREGFPYILVEALVAGCPVISTPVSGCRELLPDTALARDTTTEAITELLSSSLENIAALRKSQGELFRYANRHLTSGAMTRSTFAVYQA